MDVRWPPAHRPNSNFNSAGTEVRITGHHGAKPGDIFHSVIKDKANRKHMVDNNSKIKPLGGGVRGSAIVAVFGLDRGMSSDDVCEKVDRLLAHSNGAADGLDENNIMLQVDRKLTQEYCLRQHGMIDALPVVCDGSQDLSDVQHQLGGVALVAVELKSKVHGDGLNIWGTQQIAEAAERAIQDATDNMDGGISICMAMQWAWRFSGDGAGGRMYKKRHTVHAVTAESDHLTNVIETRLGVG